MVTNRKSNELTITRVYDAPVEAVWNAWTDVEQVAQWWGPRGFSITTHSKELKAGGVWNYTMHGPDGVDYPNSTLYHEVIENQKLVYDHGGYEDRPPMFRVTVLFSERDGKTTMEMTMSFPTAEEAQTSKKFIRYANGNSTWDRLAEYLNTKLRGSDLFIMSRSLPLSVEHLRTQFASLKLLQDSVGLETRLNASNRYSLNGDTIKIASAPSSEGATGLVADESERENEAADLFKVLHEFEFAPEAENESRVTICSQISRGVNDLGIDELKAHKMNWMNFWNRALDPLDDAGAQA